MNPKESSTCSRGSRALMLVALLIVGSLAALVYFRRPQQQPDAVAMRAMVWTCMKHPEVRRQEPGHCPVCGRVLWPEDESAQPAVAGPSETAYVEPEAEQPAVEKR